MPYWELVTRSFRIAWNHKYLWLIALFSGEGGGYSFNSNQRTNGTSQTAAQVQQQISTWISDHLALIIVLAVIWLVLAIAFFILAAICEGATIRASAEHDAERPFGLRMAWRTGLQTMWVIVRFRLLLIALYLPLIILLAAWFVGLVVAILNKNTAATPILLLTGLFLFLLWLVYAVYLFFIDHFGSRAIVLEQLMAWAGIQRAHRLLFKRFGRSLLVLLLAIGVGIVLALALACFSALVILPIVAAASFGAGGSVSAGSVVVVVVLALILIPIFLVVAGFLAAQSSTYWTLAFRRLDFDFAPAYLQPGYPQTPAAPPAPPQ